MKSNSTMYELMRRSEMLDDDGLDLCDVEKKDDPDDAKKFKEKYKEFYTDIKTDISEDW